MKKKTLKIIKGMIANYDLIFSRKDRYAECALHAVVGKIGLACELDLISLEEADDLIDAIFKKYGKLERF